MLSTYKYLTNALAVLRGSVNTHLDSQLTSATDCAGASHIPFPYHNVPHTPSQELCESTDLNVSMPFRLISVFMILVSFTIPVPQPHNCGM